MLSLQDAWTVEKDVRRVPIACRINHQVNFSYSQEAARAQEQGKEKEKRMTVTSHMHGVSFHANRYRAVVENIVDTYVRNIKSINRPWQKNKVTNDRQTEDEDKNMIVPMLALAFLTSSR